MTNIDSDCHQLLSTLLDIGVQHQLFSVVVYNPKLVFHLYPRSFAQSVLVHGLRNLDGPLSTLRISGTSTAQDGCSDCLSRDVAASYLQTLRRRLRVRSSPASCVVAFSNAISGEELGPGGPSTAPAIEVAVATAPGFAIAAL